MESNDTTELMMLLELQYLSPLEWSIEKLSTQKVTANCNKIRFDAAGVRFRWSEPVFKKTVQYRPLPTVLFSNGITDKLPTYCENHWKQPKITPKLNFSKTIENAISINAASHDDLVGDSNSA